MWGLKPLPQAAHSCPLPVQVLESWGRCPVRGLTLRAAGATRERSLLLCPAGPGLFMAPPPGGRAPSRPGETQELQQPGSAHFFFFLICFSGKVKNMGVKGGASSHVKSRREQQGHFSRGSGLEEPRQTQRRRKRRGAVTEAMAHPQGRAPLLQATGRTGHRPRGLCLSPYCSCG